MSLPFQTTNLWSEFQTWFLNSMILKSCLVCFKDSKKPPHMEARESWGWLYPQCAVLHPACSLLSNKGLCNKIVIWPTPSTVIVVYEWPPSSGEAFKPAFDIDAENLRSNMIIRSFSNGRGSLFDTLYGPFFNSISTKKKNSWILIVTTKWDRPRFLFVVFVCFFFEANKFVSSLISKKMLKRFIDIKINLENAVTFFLFHTQ